MELKILGGSGEKHGPEEDCGGKGEGVREEQICGHVGSVAVADGNDFSIFELLMICEEIGEFLGAEREVFVIELTLGETGKVTVCAVF